MLPRITDEPLLTQTCADKIARTRMDMRLARRAGLHHTLPVLETVSGCAASVQNERETVPGAGPGYVMEPLVPKKRAPVSGEVTEDTEDNAWLNDVVPTQKRPTRLARIPREQLINEHTLTCWL